MILDSPPVKTAFISLVISTPFWLLWLFLLTFSVDMRTGTVWDLFVGLLVISVAWGGFWAAVTSVLFTIVTFLGREKWQSRDAALAAVLAGGAQAVLTIAAFVLLLGRSA